MMYNEKLIASIKVNGKILREIKDTVFMPFGSEYSFLLKNLNTKRAVVNIFIDGDNIVEGGLVIDPGREIDLERSIRNGNLTAGNKFKFIERTAAIENGPRGIKLEDGLIRVEFQFERYGVQSPFVFNQKWIPGHYEYDKTMFGNNQNIRSQWDGLSGSTGISGTSGALNQVNVNGIMRGVDTSPNGAKMMARASSAVDKYCADNGIKNSVEYHDGAATMDWNDVGITVPGSKSEQKFQTVTMGALETEKHCMIFKILGEVAGGEKIAAPLTVHHKPKCVTCGKQNKATAHFCSECGTALKIFA